MEHDLTVNASQPRFARAGVDEMLEQSYPKLRALGQGLVSAARGHSIQGTDLVHEAIARLCSQSFVDDRHFFNAVALVMRHVIADRQRSKAAAKRGGKAHRVAVDQLAERPSDASDDPDVGDLVTVLEAVRALGEADTEGAEVVRLWLLGLPRAEIARVMSISESRVRRRLVDALVFVRVKLGIDHG